MQTITSAPTRNAEEPHVRTFTRWSVSRLRAAERMADGGDLRYAAEFCDAIFGDDRASAVLQTRVMSLLGLPVGFEPGAGDGRRRGRALRSLEADEDWWTIAPTATLALAVKWGLVLGVGVNGLRWVQRKGRDVPVLRNWHAGLARWNPTEQTWTTETTKGIETIAGADGRGIGGRWALFLPYGCHRPWAHGMWRGMSRWYLLKQYAIDDWGRHSENASLRVATSGLTAGASDMQGSMKEARAQLANDLFEAGKDGSVVMPHGFDLKLVELTANTRDIYEAQVNAANLAYGIQALGHNLTSEVSGAGSFAAGKVGDGVRQDYKRFDNDVVGTFAHDEILAHWASVNFGDADVAPWPIWPVEPPRDIQLEATTTTQVANAISIFETAGAPVDVRALLERFQIPMLSKEDERKRKAERARNAPAEPPPPDQNQP